MRLHWTKKRPLNAFIAGLGIVLVLAIIGGVAAGIWFAVKGHELPPKAAGYGS